VSLRDDAQAPSEAQTIKQEMNREIVVFMFHVATDEAALSLL
jgi:hypothetical protein